MIKPLHAMDDSQWSLLLQDVADQFDDVTLKRGFQYYKQGRVSPLEMPDSRTIRAVVEGSERYRVEMNLDFFTMSRCNCPVGKPCKHMVAVLLDYADIQGRSVHALANAKTEVKPKTAPPSISKSAQLAAKKREEQTRIAELAVRIPQMRTSEWHDLFELCVAPMAASTRNDQYVKNAFAAIFRIAPPLSPVSQLLFSLHAHLFVLGKLMQPAQNQPAAFNSFMGYYTQLAATDLQDAAAGLLKNKLPITDEPERWPLMEETVAYVRAGMLESNAYSYFSAIYTGLWIHWIYPNADGSKRFEDELQHLLAAKDPLDSALSRHSWTLAQIWMHFCLDDDQKAWELLKGSPKSNSNDFHLNDLLAFYTELSNRKQWSRLTDWLTVTGPLLTPRRRGGLEQYYSFWDTALLHNSDAEPRMWDALGAMLPYSAYIYEDKLHEYGKWEQWMDYQLSNGSEPLDHRVTELQPIEKNAPELLLPFYHQAVERYVLLKNRDSYKAAVKLLKRLAKLYKKMKQEARWDEFFEMFTERHSRLRALQEELRKGKLLP